MVSISVILALCYIKGNYYTLKDYVSSWKVNEDILLGKNKLGSSSVLHLKMPHPPSSNSTYDVQKLVSSTVFPSNFRNS